MTGRACRAAGIAVAAAVLFCGCGSTESGKVSIQETSWESSAPDETTFATAAQEPVSETSVTEAASSAEEIPVTAAGIFDSLYAEDFCSEMDTTALLGSEMFDSACEKLYGVAVSELTDGGVMFVGSGTLADEVSVLRGSDTEALSELLRERAARRAEEYGGYAPAEKEKASSALVFEHKGFSVLVISDRAAEIRQSIMSM